MTSIPAQRDNKYTGNLRFVMFTVYRANYKRFQNRHIYHDEQFIDLFCLNRRDLMWIKRKALKYLRRHKF